MTNPNNETNFTPSPRLISFHDISLPWHSNGGLQSKNCRAASSFSLLQPFSRTITIQTPPPPFPPNTPKTSKPDGKHRSAKCFDYEKEAMNTLHPASRVSEQRFYHLSEKNAIENVPGKVFPKCWLFESFFLQNRGYILVKKPLTIFLRSSFLVSFLPCHDDLTFLMF